MRKNRWLLAGIAAVIILAAIAGVILLTRQGGTGSDRTGIANPASVYCLDNGGKLEMKTGADGGQVGMCVFPDGSVCEEWAFYRKECSPDS